MGHVDEFVSKMLAKTLAGHGKPGPGLPFLLFLPKVSQSYNTAMRSVQKETASP
jgi:hypothetical protein